MDELADEPPGWRRRLACAFLPDPASVSPRRPMGLEMNCRLPRGACHACFNVVATTPFFLHLPCPSLRYLQRLMLRVAQPLMARRCILPSPELVCVPTPRQLCPDTVLVTAKQDRRDRRHPCPSYQLLFLFMPDQPCHKACR
jgi:hypothetical protein